MAAPASGSRLLNVAVIGATGAVGDVFLRIAEERRFPVKSLRLLATERSAGKRLRFAGNEIEVEVTRPDAIKGADLLFISATDDASREYGELGREAGAIVIDDSSVWRQDPEVPLVVPEVNAGDVEAHRGILAIPNCSTTPLVMCLWPLHRANRVTRVIADTYQSVSGTGSAAVTELADQTRAWADGREPVVQAYPHPIAFNLLPHIAGFLESGYTKEEWKMTAETRKIMHEPDLPVSATCVRAPVFIGHSLAVHAEFERPMSAADARDILRDAPGVEVQDDPARNIYPMPIDAAGKDPVYVGRIRQDMSHPNGLAMWISSDNLRKGAALNAIQIAEELIRRGLV
jgi:aspartate-semialdehyde dehydrogenase